ncbi:MAG: fatty acid hydroxylase family protein, partial [Gammaproteobacteria bacterium]|nr:fatty acid hydroxylase family protein [Gammaproteobacteria bacterium]
LTVVVVAWPLVEWLIHVFVLHQKPFQLMGRTFDLPVPRKHRAHHADPWNLEILFIPTHSFLYSLPMAAALSWLLTPSPGLALTAASGVLLMALHYEWVH